MDSKICSTCREDKPLTAFCKNKRMKDGLAYTCKDCKKAQHKKYYEQPETKEKQLQYNKKYHMENRDKRIETMRENYRKNPGAHTKRTHKNYLDSREARLEYSKQYYRQTYPFRKHHYMAGSVKRRKLLKGRGTFSTIEFDQKFALFGHKCAYCRCSLTDKTVTADHVVPISKGGMNTIDNIVPACGSCNSSKGNRDGWVPSLI